MANYGPSSAFLVVGGCDVSGLTYGLTESVEQLVEECRGLSTSWDVNKPVGVGKVMLEAQPGLYDDAAAANNEAYAEQGATRQLVAFGFAGKTSGMEVVIMNGDYAGQFNRIASKDGLVLAGAKHQVTGTYQRGILCGGFVTAAVDGDTESASNDNGASSLVGYTADLHVVGLTLGTATGLVVKVRHSADDSTFADLATFAAVTAPGSSERKSAAGTVNRYTAISWDFTGTPDGTTTATFLVALSRVVIS